MCVCVCLRERERECVYFLLSLFFEVNCNLTCIFKNHVISVFQTRHDCEEETRLISLIYISWNETRSFGRLFDEELMITACLF